MADSSISGYGALAALAAGDLLEIVDVSDTTLAATGTNKKLTITTLFGTIPVDVLPASTQKLGSATLPWLETFTGSTTQYESVVSSAGLITHAALGSATNISIVLTPKGTGIVTLPVLGFGFLGDLTTGVYRLGANSVGIQGGGATTLVVTGSQVQNWATESNISSGVVGWSSGTPGTNDSGFSRISAGLLGVGTGAAGSFAGSLKLTGINQTGANGQSRDLLQASESLTLSTSGTTTDTSADLLPANAIIKAVVVRVTTTITTATDWSVGDPTTATRFASANATMTAGATSVGLNHMKGGVATDAAGPVQVSAAKVRITTTGTPGAGVVRITVFYELYTAPTS